MGLLSGLTGAQKTKVPASGFYSTLPEYQQLYKDILGQAGTVAGDLNTDAFTPMGVTGDENAAFDMIRQGLAPTEESLRRDVSMFTNPYDDYVIGGMNREAQGQNSLVNQAATQAGQQGSNRSFLGTSDVEQNRLNNIGQFRQNSYNTAVNNVLGPLSQLRQQDIGNLMGIGSFERGLDSATQQAPYAALNANLGALNQIPTQFGNFGTQEQTIKTGGGLGGLLGGIGQIAGMGQQLGGLFGGGAASMFTPGMFGFSDLRLKEDVKRIGTENGFNIYKFKYNRKDFPTLPEGEFIGVIADEVEKLKPEAVVMDSEGYKMVNYSMIGVQMREV